MKQILHSIKDGRGVFDTTNQPRTRKASHMAKNQTENATPKSMVSPLASDNQTLQAPIVEQWQQDSDSKIRELVKTYNEHETVFFDGLKNEIAVFRAHNYTDKEIATVFKLSLFKAGLKKTEQEVRVWWSINRGNLGIASARASGGGRDKVRPSREQKRIIGAIIAVINLLGDGESVTTETTFGKDSLSISETLSGMTLKTDKDTKTAIFAALRKVKGFDYLDDDDDDNGE